MLTTSGGSAKDEAGMMVDVRGPAPRRDTCETIDVAMRVRGDAAGLTDIPLQAGRLGERALGHLRVIDTWVRGDNGAWRLPAGHASAA